MSVTDPTPSPRAKIASFIIGQRTRLTMNAGASAASIAVLPTRAAKSCIALAVASDVASPRMISTNAMTGTGLKKWTPVKRSGRSVAAASRVIEIDEVLVATSAAGLRRGHRSAKIFALIASFSVAASITRSASANAAVSVVSAIRARAGSTAPASTMPFLTARARLAAIVAFAATARSIATSDRMTSYPASAATCAMPFPINPAPMTPMTCILAPCRAAP